MNGQSSDAIDAPADVTLPLPANEMFGRMHLQTNAASVPDALQKITVPATVIQEFRPIAQSLEWELGQLYWKVEGVLPFLRNEVPFMINNDGLLAEAAAVLLFANCGEVSNPGDSIHVLELGAGTGLFARFFLDTFKAICEQEQADYYKKLVYFVTDSSRQTVAHWAERNLFSKHPSQVVLGVCDAANPGMVEDLAGSCHDITKVRAVICNYVLDVLPSTLLRRQQDRMERLCVRTHLISDAALVRQYTSLAPEEIRRLAESPRKEDRERLIPLMSLFEYETAFCSVPENETEELGDLLAGEPAGERTLINHGAIASIRRCVSLLAEDGFVLINDYGTVGNEDERSQPVCQRFGSSVAQGLNFPLLDRHLLRRGLSVIQAEGDDSRAIHTRFITRNDLPDTKKAFDNRFSAGAWRYFEDPIEEARKHLAAGQKEAALESYKTAVTRQPRNWRLIGEAGEFVGLQLRDFEADIQLLQSAIEMNPCYSTWLWNVLGDCLYCQERFADAHEAYLQAARIDDKDPRTCLNLAYTQLNRGELEQALATIATGLTHDRMGLYLDRLMEKQQQILAAIAARHRGEQERLGLRAACFRQ